MHPRHEASEEIAELPNSYLFTYWVRFFTYRRGRVWRLAGLALWLLLTLSYLVSVS